MRKVFSVALMAAMVCLVGMTRDAGATVTFSLVWTGTSGTGVTGTNSIFADPGDILTLQIRMTTDQTLGGHGVSLNFDTDLGNELNLFNPVGGGEWARHDLRHDGDGFELLPDRHGHRRAAADREHGRALAGRINTFESGVMTGTLFLPVGTYAIGTARFVATGSVPRTGTTCSRAVQHRRRRRSQQPVRRDSGRRLSFGTARRSTHSGAGHRFPPGPGPRRPRPGGSPEPPLVIKLNGRFRASLRAPRASRPGALRFGAPLAPGSGLEIWISDRLPAGRSRARSAGSARAGSLRAASRRCPPNSTAIRNGSAALLPAVAGLRAVDAHAIAPGGRALEHDRLDPGRRDGIAAKIGLEAASAAA